MKMEKLNLIKLLTIKYIKSNKKRSLITIISLTLSVLLFISSSLIFSSFRSFLINQVEDDYHVSLQTDIIKSSHIKKITKTNDKYLIKFDNITKTYKYTNEICKKNSCQNIKYNNKLLSLYGIGKNNYLQKIKLILIITLIIISFTTSIIIYNSFSITYLERNKQIGVLKSIGLTNMQIFQINILEGLILLSFAIIFGIILSIWLVQTLIVIINYLLKNLFIFKLSIYPSFVCLSILFIIISTFTCILIPSIKTNKYSIIQTVKGNQNYKIKMTRKKLNIIDKIAYCNYFRCKKKYRPITLCIIISTTLFITFNLYLNYGLKNIHDYKRNYNYQLITNTDVRVLQEFNRGHGYKMCETNKKIPKENFTEYHDKKLLIVSSKNNYVLNKIKIKGLYKSILKEKIYFQNKEFKTSKKTPIGIETYLEDYIVIFTNSPDDYCQNYITNYFINNNIKSFEEKLSEFVTEKRIEVKYVNVKKGRILTNNLILAIKIALYSFISLIILIGITTIITTCEASLSVRMEEMATLNSIGINQKQINKMLKKEVCFIIKKATIISLILISLIDYLLYYSIKDIVITNFIVPYKEFIISITLSYLLTYYILKKGYKKIDKKSINNYINKNSI